MSSRWNSASWCWCWCSISDCPVITAFWFESDVSSRWPLSFPRTTRNLAAALDSGPTELVGGSFGGRELPKICEGGSLVMELMAYFDEPPAIAACALELAPAGCATDN